MTSTSTVNTTIRETSITADPAVPTIRIVREFDAPPAKVFRAWTDPALVARWLGPASTEIRIDSWEAVTGGAYRYTAIRDGAEIASFYGSFHEVRPDERLVQTFTWAGMPDGVSLDTTTFVNLGDGRTRVDQLSVVDCFESRDAMLASGMDTGILEGYAKLDAVLADG